MTPIPGEASTTFRSVLAIGAVVLLLLLALGGLKGYRDLTTARQREAELSGRIRESQARMRALEQRIESLRNDPATLERLARDTLMMVRPGEVVVVPVASRPTLVADSAREPADPPAAAGPP